MAEAVVQPVPWVLPVRILGPVSTSMLLPSYRTSASSEPPAANWTSQLRVNIISDGDARCSYTSFGRC